MKKVKKAISIMTLLAVLALPATVQAQQWKVNNDGRTFEQAWEAQEGDSSFGFIYGYNTTWINEDYCHSIYQYYHDAALSNARGGFSSGASGGNWAKIEVRHSGTAVWYGMNY